MPTKSGDSLADPEIGSVLADRYTLEKLVGHGGMSTVYRATDGSLGRTVAVKVFRAGVADLEDVRRQQDEIQLLASLNHPALVTLFDAAADENDRAFLVLEYVEGPDLRKAIHGGPLDPEIVAKVGADVADALAYVHSRGIVHRDVKPANILTPGSTQHGGTPHAKLADFGIARLIDGARLTATGSVLGTAGYLSPEQASGEVAGAEGDIYSLGLVLIECLTGTRAFPGNAMEAAMARLTKDPSIPASIGGDWSDLLSAMTARSPGDRPTAEAAAAALHELALSSDTGTAQTKLMPAVAGSATASTELLRPRPRQGTATHPTGPQRAKPGIPRALLVALGGLVLLLVALGGIGYIVSNIQPAAEPTAPATVEYPSVDGDLGTHLEQLQRSVTP
jgi:serine/threonine protein kinase